ncbi:MAG TPA: DUF5655 domain-containing protein [Pyrinomonadaceae bacterium]|jgi:hypothetical protein
MKQGAVMSQTGNGFTVKSHFEGKAPNVRKIYDQILKGLKKFGPIKEDPKKTSIHLVNTTALAGIATRKESLVLTIKSDRQLMSPRIHRSEQASARRFHHEVKLTSPADVDDELIGWLESAYQLSS